MLAQVAVIGITFASVTAIFAAFGLFLRDLFARPDVSKRRLELVPEEPTGLVDNAFFRLVEESGAPFDLTSALMMVVGGAILGGGLPFVFSSNLLGAAVGVVAGAMLPILYLAVLRWFRVGQMQRQLPQALQAVADSVRSGQALSETFDLVAKEIKGPLGAEFSYAHEQLELGQSPLSVMNRMVRRIPLTDFRVFATAVVVHRRAGGNLSLLTERMSHSARDRQDVRNHLLAVTSGSRLSAWGMVIGSIIAVIALAWLQPNYLQSFLSHKNGPFLMVLAIFLQCLGGVWVWRILRSNF